MSYKPSPGETVLLRAVVTKDGTFVRVAEGVELKVTAVKVLTDLPAAMAFSDPSVLLMIFENENDRQAFADSFRDAPGVETRCL